ncbi:sporulation membrane protein YtaF [Paenibacillus hodogayensis]|uniref:Sporulation membrane protein YtaF n=1 Tax=Paenibacillus hodogayensis TaxID=279208 RepID=A0ABV5W4Y5_9BACL
MHWFMILGLAVSSSIDNLGVGISYGIRGIRLELWKNALISVICLAFSYAGIYFGKWISTILPGILPVLLSTFLLVVIGIRIMLLALPRKRQTPEVPSAEEKSGGLKGILQNPEKADMDRSGDIGWWEAVLLGVALSANALTNGLGAGLIGLSPLAISLSAAVGSFVTLWLGGAVGGKAANIRIGSFTVGQFGTLLSGIMLLIVAANMLLD